MYTPKLRKRLRDGVKERTGGGIKVPRVPDEVAALVTRDAVATIFPSGRTEGTYGLCNEHTDGSLSLQLVSHRRRRRGCVICVRSTRAFDNIGIPGKLSVPWLLSEPPLE